MTDDPYSTYDAAYVLGVLSPEEGDAYEQHLRDCVNCVTGVRRAADITALLQRAGPDAFTTHDDDDPPPTLLPALLAAVRRERHRLRRLVVLSSLAAAACVVALVSVVALHRPHTGPMPQPTTTALTAMTHVIAAPIDAEASLTSVAWGTRIDMRCTYPNQSRWLTGTYALVVIDTTGHVQQAATWQVTPGVSSISAATGLARADIARIEVRTINGQPVLRLSP
jgi:hypothetical protein